MALGLLSACCYCVIIAVLTTGLRLLQLHMLQRSSGTCALVSIPPGTMKGIRPAMSGPFLLCDGPVILPAGCGGTDVFIGAKR